MLNQKKYTKFFLIIVILLLVTIFAWYFIKSDKNESDFVSDLTIRLPIDIWPGNFWIIVADQNGYFDKAGLNVEIMDVSDEYDESIYYLVEGTLDANIISIFDLVTLNVEDEAGLVAILYTDSSEGAEGIASKPEIQKIEDMEGKKVGVETGTYLDFNLEVALNTVGLSGNDIIKVDYSTIDLIQAYADGEVDAVSTWEPDLSQIISKYGAFRLFDTGDVKGVSPGVFAMRENFINEHPAEVQKLLEVWLKSVEWIKLHTEELINMISKIDFEDNPGYLYTYDEIEDLIEQDIIMNLENNLLAFSYAPGLESLYGNAQYIARYLHKQGVLESDINAESMFDPIFIYHLVK